ncbi:MAG: hypothetical protein ACREQB_10030 [Candidatus Binataceae bacterium]
MLAILLELCEMIDVMNVRIIPATRAMQRRGSVANECVLERRRTLIAPKIERLPSFAAWSATMMTIVALLAGCATSPLADVRSSIARTNYVAARGYLLSIQVADLSGAEQLEAGDDLCLVNFMIGKPAVPLSSQLSTCAAAASMHGSHSGALLARIDAMLRDEYSDAVNRALRDKDATRAERAVISYRSIPGVEPQLADQWTKSIWKLIDEQDLPARNLPKRQVESATAALASAYRAERKLDDRAFAAWVAQTVKPAGAPRAVIAPDRVVLWLPASEITNATRNLDSFTRVNDALSARCGCLGRTDVAVVESGLPAYLVRLDVASKGSEVVVMPGASLRAANEMAASRLEH